MAVPGVFFVRVALWAEWRVYGRCCAALSSAIARLSRAFADRSWLVKRALAIALRIISRRAVSSGSVDFRSGVFVTWFVSKAAV